jgi:hypothetical protein
MPFGLGKSEKRTEDEDMAPKRTAEDSEVAPATGSDNGAQKGDSPTTAEAPATEDQAKTGKEYRTPVFRPDYLDEDASREGAAATTPAREPLEGDTFFVSVTKQDGSETHRFEDPAEAQAFVEQLLEDGVPQEEVAAFSGRKLALAVSHRPIVKLMGSQ